MVREMRFDDSLVLVRVRVAGKLGFWGGSNRPLGTSCEVELRRFRSSRPLDFAFMVVLTSLSAIIGWCAGWGSPCLIGTCIDSSSVIWFSCSVPMWLLKSPTVRCTSVSDSMLCSARHWNMSRTCWALACASPGMLGSPEAGLLYTPVMWKGWCSVFERRVQRVAWCCEVMRGWESTSKHFFPCGTLEFDPNFYRELVITESHTWKVRAGKGGKYGLARNLGFCN